ncbi:SUMO-activating enzyme subunit 1A [Vitis vinifera]|uniref:SUMO-activating enzyme subunit 1A n=1 Tax=Vitis vinifera TaxID=29760 RepID=A0A438EY05_VITVI|nr:SUMO-activating enzyme subunit 1A [Vitis vinifera]
MDGEELTEQETALYDRQIRVWGVDAQRRLSKAHILVSGMKGTVVEFCKNIVLAGVGSLTLVDSREVTEEALSANFLIPPDENVYSGKTLAELCCDSLKDFNPMVRVSVEKGDISSFGGDFYDRFDVVVISSCSFATKKLINEKCRKVSKRIAFYTVDCRDSCGEIYVDLQNYTYSKHLRPGSSGKGFGWVYGRKFTYLLEHYCIGDVLKGLPGKSWGYGKELDFPKKLDETDECQLQYPSFEVPSPHLKRRNKKLEIIPLEGSSYNTVESTSQKVTKLYLAMRVIERFEEAEGRNPGEISIADLPGVLKLKKELCEAQSFNESHVPDALLERLVSDTSEFPPVCAILGGILGQEVIKAISGKGDPLKNFFFLMPLMGLAVVPAS